jgi:hypothetical protein
MTGKAGKAIADVDLFGRLRPLPSHAVITTNQFRYVSEPHKDRKPSG